MRSLYFVGGMLTKKMFLELIEYSDPLISNLWLPESVIKEDMFSFMIRQLRIPLQLAPLAVSPFPHPIDPAPSSISSLALSQGDDC